MAKQKKQPEIIWHKHLDQIESDNSAEKYFIKKIQSNPDNTTFDPQEEYFTSPFENELEHHGEGQLTVDVFEQDDNIVVKSTISGINPDELEVSLENEVLTIRGSRDNEDHTDSNNYYYQECYWGKFSRSIILPSEVNTKKVQASIKNGVLKIVLPKLKKDNAIKIDVKDLD